MANLNLSTVELISTLRKVALDGAPSSSDWNDSFTEVLADLSNVVGVMNNELLPLVNALTSGALLPAQSPVGLEGRTVITDSSDQTQLFYNSLTGTPLVVADSIRLVNGMLTTFGNQLSDLVVQVASLQQRLSSSSQNDLSLAIQNITNTLNATISNLNSYTIQLQTLDTRLQRTKSKRAALSPIPASGTETISVLWTTPYPDNSYTVVVTLEAGSADLQVLNFSLRSNGTGVDVLVANSGVVSHSSGNIHVLAHYDPEVA